MSLDLSKLTNLRDTGDKKTARCPACAAEGGDSKGEHLVIYTNEAYACIAHPEDNREDYDAHNKQIFKLVGLPGSTKRSRPIPIRIRRPECLIRPQKTIAVFKSLTTVGQPTKILAVTPTVHAKPEAVPATETQKQGEAPPSPTPHKPEAEMSPLLAKSRLLSSGLRVIALDGPFTIGVKDGPDWQATMEAAIIKREEMRKKAGSKN
jgi:hypothetical protein